MKKNLNLLRFPFLYSKQLKNQSNNDFLSLTGRVKYKHHLLFIAGLPKSGKSLLENLIAEILGYLQLNAICCFKLAVCSRSYDAR